MKLKLFIELGGNLIIILYIEVSNFSGLEKDLICYLNMMDKASIGTYKLGIAIVTN